MIFVVNPGSGGAGTFISLTDVPNSYAGQANKGVRVNVAETGLEFFTLGGGTGTVTSVTSANSDISVANTTTTPVLTLNSATLPTASTIVKRDASANIYINNYFANTSSTVSAGGTTVLTVASSRTQNLTGASNQTFQLPDATTLALSSIFEFNNNSSGSLIITDNGGSTKYTVPAGGAVLCYCTSISTANGTWDFHALAPLVTTWSSGVTGLIMNSVLTTSPRIGSGASSSTAPSFIPQRGASTTGFGGDGTDLFATIAGTAALTVSATKSTVPGLLVTGLTASRVVQTDASKNLESSTVTTTELGYVSGVTSAIQTQINAKQGTITLTTTGSSGAATLIGDTLNIPQYSGGGTPAGASLTIQYNNAGAFGGMSGTSWDDTNRALTITGATVTTSNPILNLSQTWNAGAVAFTGLKLNVTNTASAAASNFFDFQVGGSTVLSGQKNGTIKMNGTWLFSAGSGAMKVGNGQDTSPDGSFTAGRFVTGGNTIAIDDLGSAGLGLASTYKIFWSSTGAWSGTGDLYLYRDAAGVLAQRNSTNAQALRVYNSYTDASNYSRLAINANQIASEVAGTGSLAITASAPVLDLAQTWNNAAVTFTGQKFNITNTASGASSLILDYQIGGTSKSALSKAGVWLYGGGNDGVVAYSFAGFSTYGLSMDAGPSLVYGGTNVFNIRSATSVQVVNNASLGWSSTSSANGVADTFMWRDAANVIGQRNSTNAQTHRVYGTYTDASNYVRGSIAATSTAVTLAAETAGTGADNVPVVLTPAGTSQIEVGNGVQFTEMTAPSAPAANKVILYAVDNGAGKTQLMALFSSGAAQQVAIEP